MATREAVNQQVFGILTEQGVPLKKLDEETLVAQAPGEDATAAVFVDVLDGPPWVGVVIRLRAPVLQDVAPTDETQAKAVFLMNNLNVDSQFGRYVYHGDKGLISLEYELLGDELQASELLASLILIATRADQLDEELKEYLGTGSRFFESDEPVA